MSFSIIGTGSYLPKTVYDNEYFTKIVDTSDEWIVSRTGIETRHIAKGETNMHIAVIAGKLGCTQKLFHLHLFARHTAACKAQAQQLSLIHI